MKFSVRRAMSRCPSMGELGTEVIFSTPSRRLMSTSRWSTGRLISLGSRNSPWL